MKKTFFTIVAMACMVSLWTIASVQAFEIITRDMVEKEVVTKTDLIKTADNFIVLFNTSGTTNQMVPGKNITKIAAFGAFVELEQGVEGLVHISQVSEGRVEKITDVLAEGQEVEARVVKIDAADRRIGLRDQGEVCHARYYTDVKGD